MLHIRCQLLHVSAPSCHKTCYISGANCYMFRYQVAIKHANIRCQLLHVSAPSCHNMLHIRCQLLHVSVPSCHKTCYISGANCYMFRYQVAIKHATYQVPTATCFGTKLPKNTLHIRCQLLHVSAPSCHKTLYISGANCYTFRHQVAIKHATY